MKPHCPDCRTAIPSEDVNLDRMVAKCKVCGTVFRIDEELPSGPAPEAAALARIERPPVSLPAHFSVAESGERWSLTRRWFGPRYIFLAFFTLFWCGFLAVWYGLALHGHAPLLFVLFPLLHVAAGLVMAYTTLAGLLNRTVLAIDSEAVADAGPYRGLGAPRLRALTVRHGPLPWPGQRSIACDEIEQLYSRERVAQGRNGPSVSYEVRAQVRGGAAVPLVVGLPDPEQALFIEQQLERRLGIIDQPVAGELPR